MAMTDAVNSLEKSLGYRFKDPKLALAALTHRSASSASNERLEFLGDAVLDLVIADVLYRCHPSLPEGGLTRLRAYLVNGDTLANIARNLGLGSVLILGAGERRAGGAQRASILADAMEATLGAIFLDSGYHQVYRVVERLFERELGDLPDSEALKDPKTRLQELLQSRGIERPRYVESKQSGPSHARRFECECSVDGVGLRAHGKGGSRRQAEQAAAAAVISMIESKDRRALDRSGQCA